MKSNHKDNSQDQQEQPARTWNVILENIIIGTVHGKTEEEARAIVAPFGLDLKVTPRD